jgi:hypothetical protein
MRDVAADLERSIKYAVEILHELRPLYANKIYLAK